MLRTRGSAVRRTPVSSLRRATCLEVFRRSQKREAAIANPQAFATAAVRVLKEKLDEWYEMTELKEEIPSWREYPVPAKRSVYDHVIYDSEVERKFVEGLEKRDDIVLYLKLPSWFTVGTPVGEYNPDWAIVLEERDEHGWVVGEKLYLVRETKDRDWKTSLRPEEYRKIRCGEAHFRDIHVDYRVVTETFELP